MFHRPTTSDVKDPVPSCKSRLGVWMFLLYALVYSGFVAINVIKPVLMETRIVFGLNLAVFYGFGLIIFAILLALIYNHKCSGREAEAESKRTRGEMR